MNSSRPRLTRLSRPLLALAIPVAAATALLGAPTAGLAGKASSARSHSPRAHAASSPMAGLGDEQQIMFKSPLWQQLHTKIVRYIAPYDAVAHSYSLDKAIVWIRAAEAQHEQVLVAFYHSEYTPTKMPKVSVYQRDVQKFIKRFPHVHQYQAWDEANRGNIRRVLSSPSANAAAQYYQALTRVCKHCTMIGLDVLDQSNISSTLRYIAEFKHEVSHLHTRMPSIWGLHNYSDVNRLQSWRTHTLARALGGQVWLTETGGIVQFGGAFPNKHGSGLRRAAKVLKYMFAMARTVPQVKRMYIYDWTGGYTRTRFDAGLMNAHNQPRPGYVIVCKSLHAAKCGGFKIAKN